jgi:hypothetical protein
VETGTDLIAGRGRRLRDAEDLDEGRPADAGTGDDFGSIAREIRLCGVADVARREPRSGEERLREAGRRRGRQEEDRDQDGETEKWARAAGGTTRVVRDRERGRRRCSIRPYGHGALLMS